MTPDPIEINTKQTQTTTNDKSNSPIHNGHRERLKKRFLANDGKDFTDHELLELLLFFIIPRVNTNELAHRLINEFGSLEALFKASPEIIERVEGAGKSTSLFFRLHSTIMKRIGMEKYQNKRFVANSLSGVGNFLCDYYRDTKCEEFCVMLLDNSLGLIEFSPMSIGSVNSASVDVRKVARYALLKDASYVILSHNHPAGTLNQSSNDRVVTIQVEAALHAVGISLMEHIIVNDGGYAPTMHLRMTSATPFKDSSRLKEFYNS